MSYLLCDDCGRRYHYELDACSFCRTPLREVVPREATVVAVTEVVIPAVGHEDVPYWCAIAEADDGSRRILKLDRPVAAGDVVPLGRDAEETLTVGVLGTGVMGKGLAELLLSRGHRVIWVSRTEDSLARAARKVLERLSRSLDEPQLVNAESRLVATTSLAPLAECDIVVEAVVEEVEPKRGVLGQAERHMRDDALLATNTSGLPVDELASALERPERFGVLHFFNPVPRMRLVEVARCASTSDRACAALEDFALSLGKQPVTVAARPAFVVNRVLMPLINEAVRSLEEDAAGAAEVDEAVRLGLNHPMGPLALADLIGLDIVVDIMDNLAERTGDESYAPRPMLRDLVGAGHLGRKTGSGFFDYASG